MSILGDRVSQILKEKKLSHSDFAKKLKVSKGFISLVLNGKRNVTIDTLYKIAKILQCNPKDLV
ncbi:MAG: hypothetical protein A2452_12235 [Candidatus Firestonebacteria bacterium RIFOXYC2_FULL_39_67]|nr:MAG: hypothetical protein A2536_07765 [Candidatus Firestonebacteria bacterium RIFOXYD2_FULL_39_29]OGF55617.1 MAG: hypothetical protein A2452_12235 [Candidatus Firestonebacteria bacterium RIFOXYC2_FULL_39_67]